VFPGEAFSVGEGVVSQERSIWAIPQEPKKAVARSKNAAQVAALSSGWTLGSGTRDAHLSGHMRDGVPSLDALDQQLSAVHGQPSITVGHEDLRAVKTRHLTPSGVFAIDQAPLVNNARGQYI
jgi:hypothetical protein